MKNIFYSIIVSLISVTLWGQASIKGKVTNVFGEPISNVSIAYETTGVTTDLSGKYELAIPANTKIYITYSHLSFVPFSREVYLKKNEVKIINVAIEEKIESIPDVVIETRKKNIDGVSNIKVETIKIMPSSSGSIKETTISIALGATSSDEMSSQYKVRGGNYDENLIYVNGIEIYRPFLARSGQQEGLSFVNVEMADNVKFSSGGFQAKYGDKLSSVLDITYRKPQEFGVKADISMLGASITAEGISPNKNTTAILGLRHRDNSLLVNSKDISANYKPRFADIQTYITHNFSDKLALGLLGNFSLNDYRFTPLNRTAKFGTLENPQELVIKYEGQENDQFYTSFGAFDLTYDYNEKLDFTLTTSVFNTQEEEYFDIKANYSLGVPNPDAGDDNYGESDSHTEVGEQYNHARNALDALIGNVQLKANYKSGKSHYKFGVKYQTENIRDRLIEWEVVDSAGFSVRPPHHITGDDYESNQQPYESFEGALIPFQSMRGQNTTDLQRVMAFGQWNYKTTFNNYKFNTTIGARVHNWTIEGSNQSVISPRVQLSLEHNKDLIFRLSGGMYAQPPMYKEMRNHSGNIDPSVKAQKSIQVVFGGDYSFQMWNRPFKFASEVYYKNLTDVNTYTVDNVRIRYAANNDAVAYATGFDMRINGEFVPGTESWFNFGYLKTEENINGEGYIARPSDQRLKFSLLFQDYVPSMPQLKMYMNLVYNTGVPGGSPTYANPYDYQLRLSDYKRGDIGVFYIFKDASNPTTKSWLLPFREMSVGGEIFNIFDISNAITNTWVRDVYSKRMYGVKNDMTRRVFNVRVKIGL